jgi:glycosyltransferase involved in cell wall biosynthesis
MRKVRIVHILTRFVPGGAQRIVQNLVEGLDKNRYDVALIIGSEDWNDPAKKQQLQQKKVELIVVPNLVRNVNPFKDLASVFEIYGFLMKWQPDIVHTHTSKAGIVGRFAAWMAKVPVRIHTPHGHIYQPGSEIEGVPKQGLTLKLFLALERMMGSFSDRIITLTSLEQKESLALSIGRADQFVTIHNAISIPSLDQLPGKFVTRREFKIPERAFIVGTVGRLSAVKGHFEFLQAAKLSCLENPDFHFVLVGEGPQASRLKSWVHENGIQDRVTFLGYQEDVYKILSMYDLFVLPSLYEGFGISVLEAWAMKLPVVATAVGGVKEVVENEKDGLLVPPSNAGAMKNAIEWMKNNPEAAQKMGEAGYEKLKDRFTNQKMVEAHQTLYESLKEKKEKEHG